jgi:hypothetical protein
MIASIRWLEADYRASKREGDGEFPSIWDISAQSPIGRAFA